MEKKNRRRPSLTQSVGLIVFLIVLIGVNVSLIGDDVLSGANQMTLLIAAGAAVCVALYNGYQWNELQDGMVRTVAGAIPAIMILLMIGVLSGTWMLSGIIPAMIHYGLYVLQPEYFLPATVAISALISVATGSSWSTVATVGVALLGIGRTLGFDEAVVAGAIISGAYFGDKISPLSDTTNLAAATTGTELFTHIRYMMYTTIPAIVLTLLIFTGFSLGHDGSLTSDVSVAETQRMIGECYRITPWLFVVPILVIVLIVLKMPSVPVLFIGSLVGGIFAVIFQPEMIGSLNGDTALTSGTAYKTVLRSMYGTIIPDTGNVQIDSLFTSRGMAGMLNTVWLILSAMIFGGVMEAGHFLERITEALIRRVRSTCGLVATTVGTCVLFNTTASDQYLAIVIPGKIFNSAYRKKRLAPEVLSRTLEDGGTVTSVLIPWNTCGATQSGVLNVATLAYLPYAFFCYLSPLMSILLACLNFKIRRLKDDGTNPDEESHKKS